MGFVEIKMYIDVCTCKGCLRGFTTIKMFLIAVFFYSIFDKFQRKWKNEFGGRFINIGLENVAVAVARVVELPPRCSNKGG